MRKRWGPLDDLGLAVLFLVALLLLPACTCNLTAYNHQSQAVPCVCPQPEQQPAGGGR